MHIGKNLGVAAGLLATSIAALATSSNKGISAEKSAYNNAQVASEDSRDLIASLRSVLREEDRRIQETEWTEIVHPIIREKLINLYKAEREDAEALREGRITDEERRVKICFVDFVGPNEIGDDGGSELNLHVVKYYDETQENGEVHRTYVNEHWPVNEENGGILPTEVIRVRAQVFDGSLDKPGAENLFITDVLQVIWTTNEDGSKGNADMFPLFARQHLYSELDNTNKTNQRNQVQVPISAPMSCISCHSSQAIFTQDLFLKPTERKTNFGAITPDEEFEKSYSEQKGFIEYVGYLQRKLNSGYINQRHFDNATQALQSSPNLENPFIVEGLEYDKHIPWVEGDEKDRPYNYQAEGFKYKAEDGSTRVKSILEHYLDYDLYGLNLWWYRRDLQLIP